MIRRFRNHGGCDSKTNIYPLGGIPGSGDVPEVLMGDPQFMDGFNGQSENKKWRIWGSTLTAKRAIYIYIYILYIYMVM